MTKTNRGALPAFSILAISATLLFQKQAVAGKLLYGYSTLHSALTALRKTLLYQFRRNSRSHEYLRNTALFNGYVQR